MKPAEKIRLVTEAAGALSNRTDAEVQLILRSFRVPTYELDYVDAPDLHYYCMTQLEEAEEEQLVSVHEYVLGGHQPEADAIRAGINPWASNPVRVFISHCHEDAMFVSDVRDLLKGFGIDAFVAHNDINPTKRWRDTIRVALSTCDFMMALLHERFHESQWCDQEVGWALGRGIPVMPIRREGQNEDRRDGFLEEHQDLGLAANRAGAEWFVAKKLFEHILAEPTMREISTQALIQAFVNSNAFDTTRWLWGYIAQVPTFGPEQLRTLETAAQENRQIFDAIYQQKHVPDLIELLVAKHTPENQAPF